MPAIKHFKVTSAIQGSSVTAGNYGGYDTKEQWKQFQYTPRMAELERSKAAYESKLKTGTSAEKSTARGMLQGISHEMTELKKRHRVYFGA